MKIEIDNYGSIKENGEKIAIETAKVCVRNHAGTPTMYRAVRPAGGEVWYATPLSPWSMDAEVSQPADKIDFSFCKMEGMHRLIGWLADSLPMRREGYSLCVEYRNKWHHRTAAHATREGLAQEVCKIAGLFAPGHAKVYQSGKHVGDLVEKDGRKCLRYHDNVEGNQWLWIADRSEAKRIR